jgi:hypothetical protein
MVKTATLVEIAKETGVDPKTARGRMRQKPELRKEVEVAKHTYLRTNKRKVAKAIQPSRKKRAK